MNKLEVGMYVRTKNGIAKVKEIKDDTVHKTKWITLDKAIDLTSFLVREQEILKVSFNIIDLIEVGDYVNGYKVLNALKFNDNSKILSLEKIYDYSITNEDIKSVVTKEQFESMKYEVE